MPTARLKVLPVASPFSPASKKTANSAKPAGVRSPRSNANVAVLASGSLSHKVISNRQVGEGQWDIVSSEFNRQMDLRVLELWGAGRYREFVGLLPEYATKCSGEALMADTAMLFGLLGWESYGGTAEQLCDYFLVKRHRPGERRISPQLTAGSPAMMPRLKALILRLLDEHRVMTIATNRPDGWPQVTTVGYVNDVFLLYFFVARNTQKYANILRDPRVSIAIGSDAPDPKDIRGLSLAGLAFPKSLIDPNTRTSASSG